MTAEDADRDAELRDLVRRSYDRIGERYTAMAAAELSPGRLHALAQVEAFVSPGARLLDVGCGAGLPMTAALAQRYTVHGVDISEAQIRRARANVPTATFERADIVDLRVEPGTYDVITAFFSLIHVPRQEHADLLGRMRSWLGSGGVLIANFGVADDPGTVDPDWLGAPMYFSQFDRRSSLALIHAAGFDIVSATAVDEPEHDATSRFVWVVARARPTADAQPAFTEL